MSTAGESPEAPGLELILQGVSTIFESLGRALICLNHEFKVVHASPGLDRLIGQGAVGKVLGLSAEELIGGELFGPDGSVRRALQAGEKREGWGAHLRIAGMESRLVSLTAAPIRHGPDDVCDPRVTYVVVVRPAEEDPAAGSAAPTIFSAMVARSGAMLRIFHLIQQLDESDATVLITGESGTGKELVARAVHVHSPRRKGDFVAVNCGALPGELLESELFGHVRGAFTGAVRDRTGRFELAAGGTIFLDEVADLPLHLQVKLLRVLQEKTFERVGESRSRAADVRVIAATNKDLRRAVLDAHFRDDLYYRLRVVPIEIPPLRERREDIEPLARHLLSKVSRRYDRSLQLAPDALRALLRYRWPGNVREMENALEYAVAVSTGQTIHAQELPVEIAEGVGAGETGGREAPAAGRTGAGEAIGGGPAGPEGSRLEPTADEAERSRIRATLEAHQWHRGRAAEALGMSRTTLWRKMREHGLS